VGIPFCLQCWDKTFRGDFSLILLECPKGMHYFRIVLNVCNLIAVSGNEEAVWSFRNSIAVLKFTEKTSIGRNSLRGEMNRPIT
jgi:hypothetical protein